MNYLYERGFSEATIKAVGWRLEQLDGRTGRYGLPPEAAGAEVWVIPYRHRNGGTMFERIRLVHDADLERFGENRKYRQPKGRGLRLYDPFGVLDGGPLDYVLLVEGEANAVAIRQMDPETSVVGLPGQGSLKEELADELGHVPVVYLWLDRQDFGFENNLPRSVERLLAAGVEDVRLLGEVEGDANELLLRHGEAGGPLVHGLLRDATPADKYTPPNERATVQQCPTLAREPRILDRFTADLGRCGLVGEDAAAKLIYLAVTSRLLDKPVSVGVKGPSSAGKSFVVDSVLGFFPASAYYALSAMSEHALIYSQEPLVHRAFVVYEATGLTGDLPSMLIRSLLSEGHIRYETVEKVKGEGLKPRLIEREGPTNLIVTTTATRLHPENETRLLSVTVTDTREQTRNVMLAVANEDSINLPDLSEWQTLQEWLGDRSNSVTVPYSRRLAEEIPPAATRLRRDFTALLGLVRAHALLHQVHRERDDADRIIANLDDYATVRELVSKLISDAIGATVRPETRQTVVAVQKLSEAREGRDVSQADLARDLKLDRGTISRRVRVALDGGYLRNNEDRRGKPARLVTAEPLPEDVDILPAPDALARDCCTVARASGGIDTDEAGAT